MKGKRIWKDVRNVTSLVFPVLPQQEQIPRGQPGEGTSGARPSDTSRLAGSSGWVFRAPFLELKVPNI